MNGDAQRWFAARTSRADDWPVALLRRHKRGHRVSVVLPALDEEATVGPIVTAIRRELVDGAGLVDELVVLDSGSRDATAAVASAAGAHVVHRADVLADHGDEPGKGEALWKSLAVTTGDIVVFCDADLRAFSATYITGLLGPLLADPGVHLVKGAFDRPLGRVTELVARPILALYWPALAGVVQPLAGEYAGRRELLESLPFPVGYGVELAILIDTYQLAGLEAIAQVDLGQRLHRHHDEGRLGPMATEVLHAALARLPVPTSATSLTQFARGEAGLVPRPAAVSVNERPPMATVRDRGDRDERPRYAQGQ